MLAVSREDRARIEAGEKIDLGSQFWFDAAGELQTEHVGSYKDVSSRPSGDQHDPIPQPRPSSDR